MWLALFLLWCEMVIMSCFWMFDRCDQISFPGDYQMAFSSLGRRGFIFMLLRGWFFFFLMIPFYIYRLHLNRAAGIYREFFFPYIAR